MAENDDNTVYINGGADQEYCKIYDKNDFFTVLVQLMLAFIALCSLWIKRIQEVPRRTFWTWFMDVFKQGLGAGYAHVLNMVRPFVHGLWGLSTLAFPTLIFIVYME